MRILHINVNYITSALHQVMMNHLDALGVENNVFVPTYDDKNSIVDCNDYVVVSKCFYKWDRFFYYHKQNKILTSARSVYVDQSYDIVHAYTLFTDGNIAMQLSKSMGIQYVVAVRNTDLNVFFKRMIHLRKRGVEILNNASAVFFLSPKYRDIVLDNYVPLEYKDELRQKCYVIPNGIDDFWHLHKYSRDGVLIEQQLTVKKKLKCLYVGVLDKNKNVELTLKALAKLNEDGWECSLTAIGKIIDSSLYEHLCSYAHFEHLEPKTKEELIYYYRNADIFIMPSHHETFGLVYAEAMTQGLPVIYTSGQGFDGQFPNGTVGYCVNDSNPQDVIDAIKKICLHYSELSNNAINCVDRFKWSDICEKYQTIYIDITSSVGLE